MPKCTLSTSLKYHTHSLCWYLLNFYDNLPVADSHIMTVILVVFHGSVRINCQVRSVFIEDCMNCERSQVRLSADSSVILIVHTECTLC